MTLRIERIPGNPTTTIRLIGRVQAEHIGELEAQIEAGGGAVVLDLEEVILVDVEVVRFLGRCRTGGIVLANGSPYIRQWIDNETKGGVER